MGHQETQTHRSLDYRPSIAGLRAIAVLGIVVFHFGATWLPGGFTGVDIFFVISGFLISVSIFRDMEARSFLLAAFFERRARRILPALFVVTLAASVAAFSILFPAQLVAYARSVLAAATFTSNIYFFAATDYFSPAAIETPLLHYWSLGVEEQFYLLFPLLVLGTHRLGRRAVPIMVACLAVASFVACEWMLWTNPPAAFYLLPFRAFEFLIGTGLALAVATPARSPTLGWLSTFLGIVLVMSGMALIDETYRFPGLAALIPCFGAALVIWGSQNAQTLPARLLGAAPLAFVGAISYSLYLVHWPIAVFWTMLDPQRDPLVFLVGGVGASILHASLSYRFVEEPVRRRRVLSRPRRLVAASSAAFIVLAAIAGSAILGQGFPWRVDEEVRRILAVNTDYTVGGQWSAVFRGGSCFLNTDQTVDDFDSDECLPGASPDVVIWGSSRMAQFAGGLTKLLAERGLSLGQITGSSCPPHLGVDVAGSPQCRSLNDFAVAEILRVRPRLVIMGGDALTSRDEINGLERSIDRLSQAGIKIVLLGAIVEFVRPVPSILAERILNADRAVTSTGADEKDLASFEEFPKQEYGEDPRVIFISPRDELCERDGCILIRENHPQYYDHYHFTLEGSQFYAAKLLQAIGPIAQIGLASGEATR